MCRLRMDIRAVQMYKYPKLCDGRAHTKTELLHFALSGYQQAQALLVPPTKTRWASLVASIFAPNMVSAPASLLQIQCCASFTSSLDMCTDPS